MHSIDPCGSFVAEVVREADGRFEEGMTVMCMLRRLRRHLRRHVCKLAMGYRYDVSLEWNLSCLDLLPDSVVGLTF